MLNAPTAIVIDDDRDNVELFCEYLGMVNIKVVGCGFDGKEAVELYEKLKPDIVFLDLMMPIYDGYYALENIRGIDPDAYIAVITAVVSKDGRNKFEKVKPDHVIHKPFDQENIVEVIAKLEEKKKLKQAP